MGSVHEMYMKLALDLAEQAAKKGEVPVGCVIEKEGRIIGHGANHREEDQDPLGHAEIMAISQAAHSLGSWRLENATLYVTLEPCPMCAGAIVNARIPTIVYGCDDPKSGAVRSIYTLLGDSRLNHQCEVIAGVLKKESSDLLSSFFSDLRSKSKR